MPKTVEKLHKWQHFTFESDLVSGVGRLGSQDGRDELAKRRETVKSWSEGLPNIILFVLITIFFLFLLL